MRRCCSLTWGLSSDKLELLYKAIIVPKLTYGCAVWASASKAKWCIKKLRSAQRHIALGICRAFKSVSTSAALILANLLPLDLKVIEILCKKSFNSQVLVPSSAVLVASMVSQARLVSSSRRPELSEYASFRCEISRLLSETWEDEWKQTISGATTREFFPSVESAKRPSNVKYLPETTQILTGHSYLNYFLAKIKIADSPICACKEEIETIHHFLFCCRLHDDRRNAFRNAVDMANLNWPPKLADIPRSKLLWEAMESFIKQTKRLNKPKRL
jgi:hypothetical protein